VLVASGAQWFAINATIVAWTDASGTVKSMPLAGGAATTVASGQVSPSYLAVDSVNAYWITSPGSTTAGGVVQAPLAGGSVTTLAAAQALPDGLAIDATHVYWIHGGGIGTVSRVPIGGGAAATVVSNLKSPAILSVDSTSACWTTLPYSGMSEYTVQTTLLAGGSVTTLGTGSSIAGCALDASSVYWTDWTGVVVKVPKGGGSQTVLASGQTKPLAPAVDGGTVYWTNSGANGAVMSVLTTGGTPTTLAATQNDPRQIAVSANAIFWRNAGSGAVMRLAK
jgi:hypothetical protein